VFLVLFDSTPESKNNMPLNPLQFKDGFDFLKKVLKRIKMVNIDKKYLIHLLRISTSEKNHLSLE
jgi:hypothetical protein